MGPEATKLDIALWQVGMGDEQPGTEDGLGEDIKDGIGNNFLVDIENAGTVSNTPDNWVGCPKDKGIKGDGSEELANLVALSECLLTAVEDQVPDDNKVGNAGNGVPAPLLDTISAEGSEETGEDHDEISSNSHQHVTTIETSEQHEVEKEERSGKSPIDIASPIDLAVDILVGIWNVLVVLSMLGMVP